MEYECSNEDGEDWVAIESFDEETAAKEFAELKDRGSADYEYANFGGTVLVRPVGSSVVTHFSISSECTPVYYASKLPDR